MAEQLPSDRWKNRIVRDDVVDADQLLANPWNSTIHSMTQQTAQRTIFQKYGWLTRCIVNINTEHVIDGHMRIGLAIDAGEQVPVTYVDVTEEEEREILALFDPVGQMRVLDQQKYQDLIGMIPTFDGVLANLAARTLGPVRDTPGVGPTDLGPAPSREHPSMGNVDDGPPEHRSESAGPAEVRAAERTPPGDAAVVSRNNFVYGFLHFGSTHVDCTADEIEAITSLHLKYRADHDGKDKGFLQWLTSQVQSGL